MTLILRPAGRGNWHTIEVRFNGKRSPLPLFDYRVGQFLEFDGRRCRVAGIKP